MLRTEHRESHWTYQFVEYAPTENAGKLPLILFLHGAGERGTDLPLVDANGFSGYIADKEIPCRFVLPQCPANTAWPMQVESVLAFLDQLIDGFDVDEDRIYLSGVSMGGFGTWYTAMAAPQRFAAIAPCCGGGMAWNAGVLTMPVWAFHGSSDGVVSPRHTEEMVEALQSLGRDVTYSRFEGVGHNSWNYTFKQELIDWLLSKKRQ